MSPLTHIHQNNTSIYYVADVCTQLSLPKPEIDWFNVEDLPAEIEVTGQATGRGTTWFLRHHNCDLVLRHYRRGGAIAKLSEDKFIYLGEGQTRPVQELNLLVKLQHWHLPAPQPIAGRVIRKGLIWQGDLITAKIESAEDTHNVLLQRSLTPMEWRHIGATIRRFHQRQVFHHDLNIHNIMLDTEGQAWLIDFDKCAIKRGRDWKKANLDRLLRSLQKESNQHPSYNYQPQDWHSLLEGYGL